MSHPPPVRTPSPDSVTYVLRDLCSLAVRLHELPSLGCPDADDRLADGETWLADAIPAVAIAVQREDDYENDADLRRMDAHAARADALCHEVE